MVFALLAAVGVQGLGAQEHGFRQSAWGDSRQAVIAKEGADYVASGSSFYYKRRVAGFVGEVEYGFDQAGRLQIGVFRFNTDRRDYLVQIGDGEIPTANEMLKLLDTLHASLSAEYPPSVARESEDSNKEPVMSESDWDIKSGEFVSLTLWHPDLEQLQLRINVDFFAPGGPLPNRRPYGPFSPNPPKDNY